jgi:hypothetical protein
MPLILTGVVHGRTIELTSDPGIADGQQVEVVVRAVSPAKSANEGICASAGAWADDAESLDEFLKEMRNSRRQDRRDRDK